MEDFINDIREANRIEDVVEGLKYTFERDHGVNRRAKGTGGLVVNTQQQSFFWVQKGWKGDVIKFVQLHEGLDFRQAVEWLADRAHMPRPSWGKVNLEAVKATREKEHAFDVAQRVFAAWLLKDDVALTYVKNRGLTDATIEASGIGFSGRHSDAEYRDMRGEFSLYGVDPESIPGVIVLGFRGDVAGWAKAHGIGDDDLPKEWVSAGRISGMMGVPGLVYGHYYGKRLRYMSRRHLPGFDTRTDEKGKVNEWKSWNPPKVLGGERQFFFNHVWREDAQECMILEGQMDAITLAQWGMPGIALAGLGNTDSSLEWLRRVTKKHLVIYVATDDDKPGQKGQEAIAQVFGPMARLVIWPEGGLEALNALVDGAQGGRLEADPLLEKALEVGREAVKAGKEVTISMLQRKLRIGYTKATWLVEDVLKRLETEPAVDLQPAIGVQADAEIAAENVQEASEPGAAVGIQPAVDLQPGDEPAGEVQA